MSTTDEQTLELIEEAGGLESGPVRLAQVVSMAARVDWALLRRARLELLPDVDPSAEADLWASSLVHTRGPDGFVLQADVAAWLQAKLAGEDDGQTRLKEAGELMLCEHKHLPPTFRLEERLTYWGLSKKHDEATLKRELGQVVRALQDPNRRALTVWVEQALDRLPGRVRQLDPALVLRDAVVAWSDVGGHVVRDVPASGGRDIWATLFTTKSDDCHPFLLRLAGDVLGIAPKTQDTSPPTGNPPSVEIQVPDTDPLFIEARWVEGDEHRITHIFPRAEEAVRLRVGTNLELRFGDGRGLAVRSGDTLAGLVNADVVRLLGDLPDSVVEKAAKQLGIEHARSAPLCVLLSGALVRDIPDEELSVLSAVLEVLEDSLKPGDTIRLFNLLTPLWVVHPSAAQQLQEAASRPRGSRGVCLNCTNPLTAELYIRRAWLGMEPPVVVTMDSTQRSSHPEEALQQVANALSRHLRVHPSELSKVLSDHERPIFLLLNLVSLSVDAILAIARQCPTVTLFLYGQPELRAPERLPVDFITYIEPALAPDAERTFITAYRDARSRWESAEERKARSSDARREERPKWFGKFDQDVYISYAHIDNQPLTSEEQGWVSRFHKSLESVLSIRLGRPAKIWRNETLRGNDIFSEEIVAQFPQTALLVSILTPRYLRSEWCMREVEEFCKSAEQTGGVVIGNQARIFKVIKTPVDTEESLPEVMKNTLGYEFFTLEDGAPLELDPAFGEKFAQDYNRKVVKLAWDVAQLLKKLAANTSSSVQDRVAPATAKPTVYLAECSYDRWEAREILEGDLKRHGYTVLPDHTLPREQEADYVAAVERDLARCALSIHLVGESYGAVPDGPSQKSLVVLQNEVAVQRRKSGALSRVIWLGNGVSSTHPQQQAFIAALHQDAEAQFGADLIITGDLEQCKDAIYDTLKKLEKPAPEKPAEQATAVAGAKLIYLLCEEKDRKATVPLRKFFREHGFEVARPVFEGDATAVREANQQLLTTCDAVLLFYGAGDEAWKRTMDNELKKMPSYRGGKPLLASYTYLADPKTSDKEDLLEMEEPRLINGFGDFAEAPLAEFIQALHPSGVTS